MKVVNNIDGSAESTIPTMNAQRIGSKVSLYYAVLAERKMYMIIYSELNGRGYEFIREKVESRQ